MGAAVGEPTIYLDPFQSTAAVGASFTVNINVTDVAALIPTETLYGWEVNIAFNKNYVNVTSLSDIVKGPFLTTAPTGDGPATSIWTPYLDYANGLVKVSESLTLPYTKYVSGASGSGVLGSVTFKVLAVGGTSLALVKTIMNTFVPPISVAPISHKARYSFFDNRLDNTAPVASFFASPSPVNVSDPMSFDASASHDTDAWLMTYAWDFGDGSVKEYVRTYWTDENLTAKTTHAYSHGGVFTAALTVTDNNGATATFTAAVAIGSDVAVVDVEASYLAVMPGVPVTVNVTVANNGYDYTKAFDVTAYYNETIIGTRSVTGLAYQAQASLIIPWDTTGISLGKYIIKANTSAVVDDYNTSNNERVDGSVTLSLTNIVDYPVVIQSVTFHVIVESTSITDNFEFTPTEKRIGFNVTGETGIDGFSNVTIPIVLLGGPYTTLLDGVAVTPDPQITTNGTHTFIYFTYTHSTHAAEVIGTTVATLPEADFTYSPTMPLIGETVAFDASASKANSGSIELYYWDFGDDSTGSGITKTHSYIELGSYSVKLNVTNTLGLWNTKTKTVTIFHHNLAMAGLTATPTSVRVGQQVSVNVTVVNAGNFTESFDITGYYNSTLMKKISIVNLLPAATNTTTIAWNTAGTAAGTYTLKANASVVAGESITVDNWLVGSTVTLLKLDTQLTLTVSATTLSLGENTTLSGTFTPTGSSFHIKILYRQVGETAWSIAGGTPTDTKSQYSFEWTPSATGDYEVKANWQGDATTSPSDSNMQQISVREPATPINILYIIVPIAIIAIVAVAVYFLKFRK